MENDNQTKQTIGLHQERKRDGRNSSLWQRTIKAESHLDFQLDTNVYDTLIVGAGITGLTTALLLQKAGKQCIAADAHQAGFGTTGGTSAHINTFADTTFAEVESAFDKESADLFARAIAGSVQQIHDIVETYRIDCDFEWKDGYVYSETDKETKQLDDLYESALRAGVGAALVSDCPAPVPFQKAVIFNKQAQFHPLKYILAMQKEFEALGGTVVDKTLIDEIVSKDDYHLAKSGDREIRARQVVYATHIPPGGVNVLHFRNAPYRSYVIAAILEDDSYPDALIYDMKDPYHYFRTHTVEGQKFLIAGGHDHKTGHGDPEQSFADLIDYTKKCYPVKEVSSQWSAQYYVPADGLPYIGELPGAAKGIYTATGFNGNGMILGTVSAMVISDLILYGQSAYRKLFDPGRIKPIAGFAEIVKESADVAKRFVGDRIGIQDLESLDSIVPDSGKVVEFQGQKLGIHKSGDGAIKAVNPVCTHTKCIVQWNNAEKSWDCPCHGARFNCDGEVLTGPARVNLERISIHRESGQ